MRKKLKIFCLIGLFYFCIFSSCFNLNTKAQEDDYSIGFTEGTELIWEVAELDLMSFNEIFGFEPNFELGDQNRIIIREINELTNHWVIDIEFWDYKTDWGLSGKTLRLDMLKNPGSYSDYLFSLTPVEEYLEEAVSVLPSEYYRTELSLFKQGKSDTGLDYLWKKEYDTRGILLTETFFDEHDQVIVRLEGTFRFIPFGTIFIGFTLLAITAIIIVMMKKKSIRIKMV